MHSDASGKIILPGRRSGRVTVPSSKSIAHRELIAAVLSGVEEPVIRGESNDIKSTRACLKAMLSGERRWYCGESGSTLRFLEPLAGVLGLKGDFVCEGRLGERPRMGFEKKPKYVVPGNISSQFVTGLLMALPLADWDSEIVVEGAFESSAYVQLTEDVLKAAGIAFEKPHPCRWIVPGRQRYNIEPRREVEGDWSQAAFFLAMGVEVDGLNPLSRQGDRAVIRLLDEALVDASQVPDLVPALAAHAAFSRRVTKFVNCARLRLKESNRLESTAAMIVSVGGKAIVEHDVLIVEGVDKLPGGEVDVRGDHRIAMSAAVLATASASPVRVNDAFAVEKSYPAFWRDFENLERKDV